MCASKMIRKIIYISIYVESILVWFISHAELGNFIAIGQILILSIASSAVMIIGYRRFFWLAMAASSWIVILAMAVAMITVRQEADNFARSFLEKNNCRPSINDLVTNSDWFFYSNYMLAKNIERYGAVRRITYQYNGLFRYGFLYDEERTIWLPACNTNNP